MKTKLQHLPKSRIKFSVSVPKDKLQDAVDHAYTELGKQVEVKGFRKGQAPKRMVFDTVGSARLRETILQRLLPDTYYAALQDAKVVPVEGPQVNIKSQDWEKGLAEAKMTTGLDYEVEVDILPQVTLKKDYKTVRFKKKYPAIEVADEEIENVLKHLRRQQAQFKEVGRPAQNEDRVELDFEGKSGGVVKPEFSSKNFPLVLGSGAMMQGFEKEIVAMKKGDKKTFTLDFPKQDGSKEKVEFSVTMNKVEEVILPELTDAMAKQMGQDSVLALRGAVRQSLRKNKEDRERRDKEQEIAEQLLGMSTLEAPASLVHQEVHRMMDTLKAQTAQYNMPWEQYLMQLKKTEQDLHHDFEKQAENTVKFGLILGYIMSKEKIDSKTEDSGRKTMDKLLELAAKK